MTLFDTTTPAARALGAAGAPSVAPDLGDGDETGLASREQPPLFAVGTVPSSVAGSRAIVIGEDGVALLPVRDRASDTVVYAKIDADLAPAIGLWKWSLDNGYVFRMERLADGKQRQISLHRLVMCCAKGDGLEIDHINRDRLDNRRVNLRYATRAENVANRGTIRPAVRRKRVTRTECVNGHPYTPESTRITRAGHHRCLICQHEWWLRNRERCNRERAQRHARFGRRRS